MRCLLLISALALAACDSPNPLSVYAGVPPTRVEVEGSVFSVRVAGSQAQAVRTDFDLRAGLGGRIVPRAGIAIERASGCRVVDGSLKGDAALIEARLIC